MLALACSTCVDGEMTEALKLAPWCAQDEARREVHLRRLSDPTDLEKILSIYALGILGV